MLLLLALLDITPHHSSPLIVLHYNHPLHRHQQLHNVGQRVDLLSHYENYIQDEAPFSSPIAARGHVTSVTIQQNISADTYTQAGSTFNSLYPGKPAPPPLLYQPMYVSPPHTSTDYISSNLTTPETFQDSEDIFEVVFLSKRIKKCYGCGAKFTKNIDGSPLPPPQDIVIRHSDHREYYTPSGEKRLTSQKQNTYFHPVSSCIIKKYPDFTPHSVDISSIQDNLHMTF